MTLKSILRESDEQSRRAFLANTARGLLGLGAMPLFSRFAGAAMPQDAAAPVALRPATARNVIYLYMSGGMSHLDTFDLKPGSEVQGPIERLKTNADDVFVSQHFPLLARHMDKVAVINSLSSNQGAHEQGRYFMHTSYEMRGTIKHPTLGSWVHRMAGRVNPNLPGHVTVGNAGPGESAGFLESRYLPLPIGDPEAGLQNSVRAKGVDEKTFARRLDRLRRMNGAFADRYGAKAVRGYSDMYDDAVKLMSSADLEAFDLEREPEAVRAAYGDDPFGQGCLLARRLVEHGVRFVEVTSGGWDTHNDNFEQMEEKCPVIDRALASLLADLEARGLLDETIVVLATEFGRTPEIVTERNSGRNHHPKAFSGLLAGGGIRGGRTWGKTDERGENVIENKVLVPDFNATIAHALGLPLDHVLTSPSGRPFTVAHKGKPILELFA
ncbi:MAG: DUF1501 domain-containing protein [Planctomycetota bacterium]